MASPTSTARSRASQAGLDADDKLAMRTAELAAWAQRNVKTIVAVAGVVLVLLLGYFGYRYNQQRTADRASAQWLQVQDAAAQGAAGIPRLSSFATTFAGTPEGAEARLTIAAIHLDANQPQKAVEEARQVADGGTPLAFQGRMMLGAALAKAGQRDEAIRAYTQAAETSTLLYQRQEARNEAALLMEMAGNWSGAAAMYRTMLTETEEGTLDRSIIELRVAEAEARATPRR